MKLIDAQELVQHLHMINFMDARDRVAVIRMIDDTPEIDPRNLIKKDIKERPIEFASIIFRPICSFCGRRLINETIDCIDDKQYNEILMNTKRPFIFSKKRITPDECPYCHASFDCIEMPCGIPYTDK